MGWNSSTGKLTVDPINRMEGHMGAGCVASWATGLNEAPGSVRIVRAEMHGNLFRGFENILPGKFKTAGKKRTWGRDPKDAMIFTQRICGVCPIGHGTASSQNIGNLLGYKVHNEDTGATLPPNAPTLRNLLLAANHLMSHILHFYHLVALDYVNPGLMKPFLCPRYDDSYYIDANRVAAFATAVGYPAPGPYKPVIDALLAAGGGTIPGTAAFINSYLVGQYLKALDMRRVAHEMLAIFGGKGPIAAGYTPGGVTATVDASRIAAYQTKLNALKTFIGEPTDFLNVNVGTMMFDTVAAAHMFPEYFWIGNAWNNFMAYGWGESNTSTNPVDVTGDLGAILGDISNSDNRLSKRGRQYGGATAGTVAAAGMDGTTARIIEAVKHSRYNNYATGNYKHPWSGETTPFPTADPDAPIGNRKYSWLKAPRYLGPEDTTGVPKVYEVGPLARMRVQGYYFPGVLNAAGYALCPTLGAPGPQLNGAHPYNICYGGQGPDLSPIAYNGDSILDRIAARTVETRLMIDMAQHELNKLVGGQSGTTEPAPQGNKSGYGMTEASRGALGHWVKTEKHGRISLYQCVVPTTWNGGPRDANDNPGPAEKSLQGNNSDATALDPSPAGAGVWIKDPRQPIELIRATHSYDYCIACAVHLVTPDGEVTKVVVPALP